MELKEFTEKVKEIGYEVEYRLLNNEPLNGAFIVSKDDYYHVPINPYLILKEPFDYVISFIEKEIEHLKSSEATQ